MPRLSTDPRALMRPLLLVGISYLLVVPGSAGAMGGDWIAANDKVARQGAPLVTAAKRVKQVRGRGPRTKLERADARRRRCAKRKRRGKPRRCYSERQLHKRRRGKTRRPRSAVGGGFGLLAPWPVGTTLTVGRPCGSYFNMGAHRLYGGAWGDDRYAIDVGTCGGGDFGTPILAAHDGVVRQAYYNSAYGNTIVIEASNGVATRYAHLANMSVGVGRFVRGGQQIGAIGHSGSGGGSRSNSHLHFVAYNGRGSRAGFAPSPLAGVHICNGCRVRSQTSTPQPDLPPFRAGLDAQFPVDRLGKVYAVSGGSTVNFGFNVRFNQDFSVPNFVLRPETTGNIAQFATVTGDFPGAKAPNDVRVGYYRAGVRAPADTPPGSYFIRWNAVHKGTGQFGNLQPAFELVVLPPRSAPVGQPCPPPAPGGPFALSSDPSFRASLDAQFPIDAKGRMYVSRGDTVGFGFNVRYNQPFNAQNFALRTDTPGTINYFSTVPGDWRGAVAGNDGSVGFYRASVRVPTCTPSGQYFLRWNPINMATGKWGGIQPSFMLVVP